MEPAAPSLFVEPTRLLRRMQMGNPQFNDIRQAQQGLPRRALRIMYTAYSVMGTESYVHSLQRSEHSGQEIRHGSTIGL